jgi:hypothetical protein
LGGRKFLLFYAAFSDLDCERHHMLGLSTVVIECRWLATFSNFEISGLADRFLIEIEENVNPRVEKRQPLKIPSENRKNMQAQIVACNSREMQSGAACFVRISRAISLTQAESRCIAKYRQSRWVLFCKDFRPHFSNQLESR